MNFEDFFQCKNTLSPAIFESQWQSLKEKYSSVSGANSTQHIESLNKKVHDSVNSCSSFLTLVKEIQQLLDDEANYIRIQKYKDEISSIGLEYTHTEDNYNEGIREDHYEIAKILLDDISATITKSEIVEIWQIVVSCGLKNQYVYKDNKITSNSIIQQTPISIYSSEDNATNNTTNFNLRHITKIRGSELYTPILQELNNNRIKYGRAHDMLKKAINLALATNSYKLY
ncbi:hypothetical protein C1646_757690 [Rhizophagus diaphanus]|nr:hypothetical protein C1646_757690 [Rhizophagus diaphanus] [Rhizophagus sp. MUCL 43196]